MRSPGRRSALALVVLLAVALPLGRALRALAPRSAHPVPAGPVAAGPVAAGPSGSPGHAECAGPAPEAVNTAFEAEVVELVNAERRAAGLPPLAVAAPLAAAARWFARDMAVSGYFASDHDTYARTGGQLVRVCGWSARISSFAGGWSSLAENIAAGATSPRDVVAGWMGSPTHRANILGRGFSETGVGYWSGGPQGSYWVQDFGQPGDDARAP
jgi:uncharacterized protein YkwD